MAASSGDWNEMKPGKPFRDSEPHIDKVYLAWETPKVQLLPPINYEVRYKIVKENSRSGWIRYKKCPSECFLELENLPSGAKFIFKVRMINEEEEGPYSEESDEIETVQSAASRMLPYLVDVKKEKAEISVKCPPFIEDKKFRDEKAKIRKLEIGTGSKFPIEEKTIMIVGPTGSGKSTLVDSLINYIFGVSWGDLFRLTVENLEVEEMKYKGDQAKSQTVWITCYTIHPMIGTRIHYKLTIIDTPGYGHVDGIEADKGITEQIREFFTYREDKEIAFLDAVCFVIKAPDARLTKTQEYVFNSILSVFGKDIIENFCMMVTFADGKTPEVIAALKAAKLPEDPYFSFNNSVLFAANIAKGINTNSENLELERSVLDWHMAQKGLEQFFFELEKMRSKSLRLSNEVLVERKMLEITVSNVRDKLRAALQIDEELDKEIQLMTDITQEVETNRNFYYTVNEQTLSKKKSRQYNLNCKECETTCHKKCWTFNLDIIISFCEVFLDGKCTQCKNKCNARSHKNEMAVYEYTTSRVQRTYEDMRQRYTDAANEKLTHEDLINKMLSNRTKLYKEIKTMCNTITESNKRLNEIALRSDPLHEEDQFDLWINEEKMIKSEGWLNRVKKLLKYKRRAQRIAGIDILARDIQQICDDADTNLTPLEFSSSTWERIKDINACSAVETSQNT